MPAHEGLELGNQLLGFFVGDKFSRLHRVYEQLQFRKLKATGRKAVERITAGFHVLDFHTEVSQLPKVEIQSFSIGIDAAGSELINDFRHAERVLGIGFFRKKLGEIQKL